MPREKPPNRLETLAANLACGASVRKAAAEAGIPESTARLRASDPKFKARVRELRDEMMRQTLGILTRASVAAAVGQVKLLAETNADVRQRAITALHERIRALTVDLDQAERLAALEAPHEADGPA